MMSEYNEKVNTLQTMTSALILTILRIAENRYKDFGSAHSLECDILDCETCLETNIYNAILGKAKKAIETHGPAEIIWRKLPGYVEFYETFFNYPKTIKILFDETMYELDTLTQPITST